MKKKYISTSPVNGIGKAPMSVLIFKISVVGPAIKDVPVSAIA